MTHEHILELWHERAAIMEYCGGMTREQADLAAYWEMRKVVESNQLPMTIVNRFIELSNKTQKRLFES